MDWYNNGKIRIIKQTHLHGYACKSSHRGADLHGVVVGRKILPACRIIINPFITGRLKKAGDEPLKIN